MNSISPLALLRDVPPLLGQQDQGPATPPAARGDGRAAPVTSGPLFQDPSTSLQGWSSHPRDNKASCLGPKGLCYLVPVPCPHTSILLMEPQIRLSSQATGPRPDPPLPGCSAPFPALPHDAPYLSRLTDTLRLLRSHPGAQGVLLV